MTVVYITEHNCRCYGVTFQNTGCTKVQKFKNVSNHEKNILYIKHSQNFLGKSEVCDMNLMSRVSEESVFDGKLFYLK